MGSFSSPILNDQRGPRDHSWPYKTKAVTAQCLWSRLTRYPSVTIQRSTNLATHSVPFASFAATTVWHKAHLVFFLWRLLMVAGWRMSLDFDWKKMLLEVSLCPQPGSKTRPYQWFLHIETPKQPWHTRDHCYPAGQIRKCTLCILDLPEILRNNRR